ncbi:MAG TPA: Uma2 family endonuclease [Pyrinomonadaceae bacterium]|nr:Uma2 family endonuclease [Chloracidobacterium sp.]MBP9934502.1 Uma2 family endonuclease [Pyrinomonadaceae bacterium]MBK7802496.1 Uma2 family endonuclease [Chloracidobacterium sp.]MBK9437366.1 Uma2 family endonuclease [Chloracidobacterium sp.]MBL0240040.1 Uma2 family endonuclease [Chloracidobacterium sp.]
MNQTTAEQTGNKQSKNFTNPERRDVVKNEYLDGRLVAKPAANRWHNLISSNFAIAIGSRIHRSTCELYANDMLVQLGKNSVCFPDIVVVNGEPVFNDQTFEVIQNPTVVIEIFSSVANTTDRTQKLEGFLAIPKIKECLLVNENEMRIEHYARQNAKQWIYRIYNERDDVISLESINCKLSLAEVYAQVKLKESELSSKAVN